MEQKSKTIFAGAFFILLVASLLGAAFYFGRSFIKSKSSTPESEALKTLVQIHSTPASSAGGNNLSAAENNQANSRDKIYLGEGFKINYPKKWGLLICSNSQNFEFDPAGGSDVKNVVCNTAIKPVTVLVSSGDPCQGISVQLGSFSVVKGKTTQTNGDIHYCWKVTLPNKFLNITHRVSSLGSLASSKDDFSSQIDQLIPTIQTSSGS